MSSNSFLQGVSITRRGFFAATAAFALALKSLPVWAADKMRKVAFGLGKAEKLKEVGGSAILELKGRNVLFVRDTEKTIRAFDPTCTHNKCNVAYAPEERQLRCPCHRSAFSLEGEVRGGPAPRPLTMYPAKLDGDRVIVSVPVDKP